jgi:hypothetical protein
LTESGDKTTSPTIRPAFSQWPEYDRLLRERLATLTEKQLAFQPAPGRWPLWASIRHVASRTDSEAP